VGATARGAVGARTIVAIRAGGPMSVTGARPPVSAAAGVPAAHPCGGRLQLKTCESDTGNCWQRVFHDALPLRHGLAGTGASGRANCIRGAFRACAEVKSASFVGWLRCQLENWIS